MPLGNLLTTNGLGQSTNITTLSGGPYNRVSFSTNWSHNSGGATSLGVGINFNAGAFYNIISGLVSISGFNNNPNPSAVNALCTLTMPVSSATALSMIRGQNITAGGYVAGDWSNVSLNFSYVQRPVVLPSGIRNLGAFTPSNGASFSIVPGGSGGFNPVVGLYSSEGYLIASNIGAAGNTGGGGQTGLLIGSPAGDPGLSNLAMPEGSYYFFVGGTGTTFTPDDFVGTVPGGAPGGSLLGSIGGVPFSDPFAQGQGRWYGFTIVPAPTSLAVLGLGGLMAARRRRR